MKLFVSALEYSANVHLKYLLRELVKCENIELCGIFDEKMVGNLSLGLHSADFANLGHCADFSLALRPKFAKNHESQTENPSVVDSALGAESSDKIKSKKPFKSFCSVWLSPKVESPLPLNHNLPNNAESQNLVKNSAKIAESSTFSINGTSLCNTNSIAVMGFIDVLKKAKFFLDLRKKCLNLALTADKILLMDSSSFNIPLAKRIKKRDKTKQIIYYILPQVWAWKPWRAKAIEANCDRLAAILPFEVGFYKNKAEFVGHPLLDEIKAFRVCNSPLDLHSADFANFERCADFSPALRPKFAKNHESQTENPSVVDSAIIAQNLGENQAQFAESNLDSAKSQNLIKNNRARSANPYKSFCSVWLSPKVESPLPLNPNLPNNVDSANLLAMTENKNFAESTNIFSFMPGSRTSEIKRIFPIFAEVKDALKSRDKNAKFHLIIPQKFASQNLAQIYGDVSDFHISFDAHRSLFQSRFAFICSGTATLECALIGTPFVLGYKCRALEAFVARCFLNVKFIGLANILYEKISPNETFHTELIQGDLSAQNLLGALDSANENDFLQKSLALRKYLKCGSASAVAKMLYGL